MKKKETLDHWRAMPDDRNPLDVMRAIAYKTTGARYGLDGIRIDGSPEFIDAVLSRLKPLLAGENASTRLELSYNEVKPRDGHDYNGGHCCYIRLHERGQEAKHINAMYQAATGRDTILSAGY